MIRVSLAVLVALPLHAAAQPGFGVPNSPDLCGRMPSSSGLGRGHGTIRSARSKRWTPASGIVLSETIRTATPRGSWTESTALRQLSDAPIDPAVFEIPPDYRPALSIWGRGYDSTHADTYFNRALLVWETARDFARQFWR